MTRDSRGRSRAPRPVGESIGRFQEEFGPKDLLGRVQALWGRVAGEAIASASRVVDESEGRVEIECESSVWAEELSLMEPRLKGLLNEQLGGEEAVEALRFRAVGKGRIRTREDQ